MYTSDELRAAVERHPAYAGFRGDGASVPWQVSPPGLMLPLLAYKTYLDLRWPEAFRRHDFLYDPISSDLGHTREEADTLLYDDISVDSRADAWIVYRAVRIGGGFFFRGGNGIKQPTVAENAHDMGVGAIDMPLKITLLMEQTTNTAGGAAVTRVAGWSESVYYPSSANADQLIAQWVIGPRPPGAQVPSLSEARAGILPHGGRVVGARVTDLDTGRSRSYAFVRTGDAGHTDMPTSSLLVNIISPTGASRRITIRDIPDSLIVQGEYVPAQPFTSRLHTYLTSYTHFAHRVVTRGAAQRTTHIAADGWVTLLAPPGPAKGARVELAWTDATGRRRRAEAIIIATDDPGGRVQVAPWTGGVVAWPASLATINVQYPLMTGSSWAISRMITRRVGRPFVGFRGRRSRRRA